MYDSVLDELKQLGYKIIIDDNIRGWYTIKWNDQSKETFWDKIVEWLRKYI